MEVPIKRKRGRPHKFPRHDNRDNTGVQISQNSLLSSRFDDVVVGQQVHGVVEGIFGDGYFVQVQVENSDNVLRGAVFKPTHCVPVSEANDVAPNLPMIKRTKIPLPAKMERNRAHIINNTNESTVPCEIMSGPLPCLPFEELLTEVLKRVENPLKTEAKFNKMLSEPLQANAYEFTNEGVPQESTDLLQVPQKELGSGSRPKLEVVRASSVTSGNQHAATDIDINTDINCLWWTPSEALT